VNFSRAKSRAAALVNGMSIGPLMEKGVSRSGTSVNDGFTLWFTGLPGAGKSTLAELVAEELARRDYRVEVLDGEVIRTHLSSGLGFSKEDRNTNIRRIGYVCNLLARNGVIAIAAAISPYRDLRDEIRSNHQRFFEVYMECPLEVLVNRDTKGLYKMALRGEILNFTGITSPYEPPLMPELIVHSDRESRKESLARLLDALETLNFISSGEVAR
jgi:adenylyl-sulfate kinase